MSTTSYSSATGKHVALFFDLVFKLWFLFAAALFVLGTGWAFSQFGTHWIVIVVSFMAYLLAFPTVRLVSHFFPQYRKGVIVSAVSFGLVSLFITGYSTGRSRTSHIQKWLKNSTAQIVNTIKPVTHYPEGEGVVAVAPEKQQELQGALTGLHMHTSLPGKDLLVSFEKGLVVIRNGTVTFLTERAVTLSLSSPLPDGSFIYFSIKGTGDPLTVARSVSMKQILTRARIENGALQKIWERDTPGLYLNHWGDTFDGKIYYPGRSFAQLPNPLSAKIGHKYAECRLGNGIHDAIRIFHADTGEFLRSIDLLPILASFRGEDDAILKEIFRCSDPLHLNDVQVVKTQAHARYFPNGKVGDLLVSIRDVNTLLLLDRDTDEVKWYVTDATVRQHSPRLTDRGTMLIFDNRASDRPNGRSRVTELDIATRKVVGFWEATGEDYFESFHRGKVSILDDGKILVQEQEGMSHDNRMFTLDCGGKAVSLDCKKSTIFTGISPIFRYDNALVLDQ